MAWNHFDLIATALIFLIGLKGLYNGAVHELSGLIGVVSGVLIGSRSVPLFSSWMTAHLFSVGSSSAMTLIAFLLLLTLVWMLCIFLGVLVVKRFEPAFHSWLDRLIGFLFASLKVFIILSVIVYSLSTIEFIQKNAKIYVENSRLYPFFLRTGSLLMHLPDQKPFPEASSRSKGA